MSASIQNLLRLWLRFSSADKFDNATWNPRVAQSSAKPPPMQKPMIPIRPLQSSCAARNPRAASISW